MGKKLCSDEDFILGFESMGASAFAKKIGADIRSVQSRRKRLQEKSGVKIKSPVPVGELGHSFQPSYRNLYDARVPLTIRSGIALIGSDAHIWPGPLTTAQRAFLWMARELGSELKLVCLNGDILDGAGISRHAPIGWNQTPTLKQELEAVEEFTSNLFDQSKAAEHMWTVGNHDARFENRLASNAPEFEGIPGFTLADRFALWKFSMSIWINDNSVIKHRFKGGIHATHNNALWAGKHMTTGHLHSLKVTPLSDYNGTRFGVDTGTMSDPYGLHASYGEDNPLNHRSGFVVETYHEGVLLWPEIVAVVDEHHIQFRGKLIRV